uniref:Sulfotransferase n=1 Tax=Bombyx mori TaxID=7091 RepID=A0PCF9_BOMMO|nr:sulfotransferase [Bombyx mori]
MAIRFPHEIKPVTEEEDLILKKYYKGYSRPFVRVGAPGYLATPGYQDHAEDIYNLEIRPDDIWVIPFSRSGTTWLQELVWLVNNNLDYVAAASQPLSKRYAYIEYVTQKSDAAKKMLQSIRPEQRATFESFETLPNLPSPRYVKSHLPLSRLPPALLDTAKVFYIARDPRDVAVSLHFAVKLFGYFSDEVTFKEFWDLFKRDLVLHTPIFSHVKEAWEKRHNPNLFFLFYEDMQNNLPSVIDKVCNFLNKAYTAEQKAELARHLSFESMKKTSTYSKPSKGENSFFRKGKSGSWVEYFDDAMKEEAMEFMEKNLSDTDMRYPVVEI